MDILQCRSKHSDGQKSAAKYTFRDPKIKTFPVEGALPLRNLSAPPHDPPLSRRLWFDLTHPATYPNPGSIPVIVDVWNAACSNHLGTMTSSAGDTKAAASATVRPLSSQHPRIISPVINADGWLL